jgi:hypothetical protein
MHNGIFLVKFNLVLQYKIEFLNMTIIKGF